MATGVVALPAAPPWKRYAGDIILVARIIAGLAILFAARHGGTYVHHIAFIAGIALVTWFVRGMGWARIYDFFVIGVLGAYAILGLQWVIEIGIMRGAAATFRGTIIASLTEEPLKVAPLIILILLLRSRARWWSGACDLMACGAALGSGFAFVEDSLRHATQFPETIGPRLFGIPLMPDAYRGFIGHGGATAFIALAFGWWTWASRRKKWRELALIPVAFVAYWMMLDHSLVNYDSYSMDRFSAFIWRLDGRGTRAPYIFVFAVVITLIAEVVILLRTQPRLRRVPLSRVFRYVSAPLDRGFGYPELRRLAVRVRGVFVYWLTHRQMRHLIAHRRGDAPLDERRYAEAVKETAARLLVAQGAITNP